MSCSMKLVQYIPTHTYLRTHTFAQHSVYRLIHNYTWFMLDSFYGSWVVNLLKYDSSYFEFALDIRSLSSSLACSRSLCLYSCWVFFLILFLLASIAYSMLLWVWYIMYGMILVGWDSQSILAVFSGAVLARCTSVDSSIFARSLESKIVQLMKT